MYSKVMYGIFSCVLLLTCCASAALMNRLTEQEMKQGFELLFDGKTMDQWRNYKSEGVKPQWQIID